MPYRTWGFVGNPFETSSLPPTGEGERLLVGRDDTLKIISRRIQSGPKLTTIEGLNGVGKTSVVNVAAFGLFRRYLETAEGPLFIPCRTAFQLDSMEEPAEFRRRVLREVAQTLFEQKSTLPAPPGFTGPKRNSALERWLNSPQLQTYNAGGFGFNAGYNSETNTSSGFELSGFEKIVNSWLEEIFPDRQAGAVVCIIDNLELLQTSQKARDTLESLRDSLFSLPGIRWVLCGALGIVHGVASSPRLEGYLHKPIEIQDLPNEYAPQIFETRVRSFKASETARLPLTIDGFLKLFSLFRGNLRSVLSASDEFCNWVADKDIDPELFNSTLFEDWLNEEMETAYKAVRSELRPRALEVFETACTFEVFSPSDCVAFGYDTPMALRPQIKSLEAVGLLVSTQDETDKRRKTIQVTGKGWKVRHFIELNRNSAGVS